MLTPPFGCAPHNTSKRSALPSGLSNLSQHAQGCCGGSQRGSPLSLMVAICVYGSRHDGSRQRDERRVAKCHITHTVWATSTMEVGSDSCDIGEPKCGMIYLEGATKSHFIVFQACHHWFLQADVSKLSPAALSRLTGSSFQTSYTILALPGDTCSADKP